MSAQQMSYGWHVSAGGNPRSARTGRRSGRRSAMKRSCPARVRRADRRSRRIDPRSSAPFQDRRDPVRRRRIASSIAASTSRALGKEANDRGIAVGDARCCRGSQSDRQAFAGQPVVALCMCTATAYCPQLIRQVLFERGISVCTANSMSRSDVPGPRLGATAVSIHALRFWYMRPRVPSIGSTMMQQSADASSAPAGRHGVPRGAPLPPSRMCGRAPALRRAV
jgi:hypothetical protein